MSRNKAATDKARLDRAIATAEARADEFVQMKSRDGGDLTAPAITNGPPLNSPEAAREPLVAEKAPMDIRDRIYSTIKNSSLYRPLPRPLVDLLLMEAHDEIVRLRAEVATLKAEQQRQSDYWREMWERPIRETNPEFDPEQRK